MRNLSIKTVFTVLLLLVLTNTSCVKKEEYIQRTEVSVKNSHNSRQLTDFENTLVDRSLSSLEYLFFEMPTKATREYVNTLNTLEYNYVNYLTAYQFNDSEKFEHAQIAFYEAVLAADKKGITVRLYDPAVGMVYNGYELKVSESITIRQ